MSFLLGRFWAFIANSNTDQEPQKTAEMDRETGWEKHATRALISNQNRVVHSQCSWRREVPNPAQQCSAWLSLWHKNSDNDNSKNHNALFTSLPLRKARSDRGSGLTIPMLYPPPPTTDMSFPCSPRCMAMVGGSEVPRPLGVDLLFPV